MTEGVTLLTLTIKIKYYIEDIIFKNFKKLKKSEGVKITKKKVFINKISKTFDIFGQQSPKKKIIFFSALSYGITQQPEVVWLQQSR